MSTNTTAGAKIYIGTTAAATNVTAFAADTYVEIKEVEDLGEIGDEAEIVSYRTVGDGRVQKRNGSRDAGTLNLVCIRDPLDAGQRAMIDASKTDGFYNVKVAVDDAPAGGTATVYYFKATISSAKVAFGGADDMTKINFGLAITSEIFEVEAEAA